MKTLKFSMFFSAVLCIAGMLQLNAQAYQEKDVVWNGGFWVGCANGGQGEWIVGTVYQQIVYNGNPNGKTGHAHWNFDPNKSIMEGWSSGEIFRLGGVSNFMSRQDVGGNNSSSWESSIKWNDNLVFKGDRGTEIIVRATFHLIVFEDGSSDVKVDIYFENCRD